MATLSEQSESQPASALDFQEVFAAARRRVLADAGGVRELRLELDGPPLRARSHLVTSGDTMFVRGENQAHDNLILHGGNDSAAPLVALHLHLRGNATAMVDGLTTPLTNRAGHLQLYGAPNARTTVRLRAGITNEAFRINMTASMLAALAARHPQLEAFALRVATRRPFSLAPVAPAALPRLLRDVRETMASAGYGAARPLYLESRALSWLALVTAAVPPAIPGRTLPAREVDRMHDAEALLRSRLVNPPTLAEVATAIGTNDFALKRNFKAVFGQPVYAHLLAIRLAHACVLLKDTRQSIKEVATAVGYAYPNHFTTAFRRAYGLSPGQYRRAH